MSLELQLSQPGLRGAVLRVLLAVVKSGQEGQVLADHHYPHRTTDPPVV